MKRYLCVWVLAVVLAVFSLGCSARAEGNYRLTAKQMESLVTQLDEMDRYEGYETAYTEVKTINSIKLYGAEKAGNQITLYIWDFSGSYVKYKGASYEVAGGCYPLIVTAAADGESLDVTDIKMPQEGAGYAASIKKMFPDEYAEKILNEGLENYEKLHFQQNERLKDYWGAAISDDSLTLNERTGAVSIIRTSEGYNKKGEYFYKKEIVDRGYMKKKQEVDHD